MKIAILSGKGGTGKTMLSVNIASSIGNCVYIDCDVEEPNGHIFLKPENINDEEVCTLMPKFDADKCTGCRNCTEFCRFNALIFIKNKPMVFDELCHSCGGCALVCKENAITEMNKSVGMIKIGQKDTVHVITGIMNTGEASGVPVISAALQKGFATDSGLYIIDCPPGSSCSVMESIRDADCCILVTEPTSFGLHNLKLVAELTQIMNKPSYVVINKAGEQYPPLESFCKDNNIEIKLRIPFSEEFAHLLSEGKIIADSNALFKQSITDFINSVKEDLK